MGVYFSGRARPLIGGSRATNPHHPNRGSRIIPLFPELRPYLEEAFEQAAEGSVHIITRYRDGVDTAAGWRNINLRTQFERIIDRAGLTPWPRLFHALRASRETELVQEFPVQCVTAWLGNTPRIALKHYLMVSEEHFEKGSRLLQTRKATPQTRIL